MENGMKPEETVQKYVTLEEYSDSYKLRVTGFPCTNVADS